jgi:uncharacterized membrane protein YcaP (DUF421 family)
MRRAISAGACLPLGQQITMWDTGRRDLNFFGHCRCVQTLAQKGLIVALIDGGLLCAEPCIKSFIPNGTIKHLSQKNLRLMNWIYTDSDPLIQTIVGCFIIFLVVIVLTRLIGLRAFAKFTAYDFAFTVATGSIVSSILTSSTTLAHGATAIGGLLFVSFIFSKLQRKYSALDKLISNAPLLIMEGSKVLYENLETARIEEEQLYAKLREANVLHFEQVVAVVLESTGDISVLHTSDMEEKERFDTDLLLGVKRTK